MTAADRPGPPAAGLPLEPSPDQLRELLAEASAFVERFVATVADQPASDPVGDPGVHAEIRATVADAPTAEAAEALRLIERGLPEGFNTAGPGFMAYIPGGGLISAGVADLVACAVNRYIGMSAAAPAMTEIEWRVVRWLCELFGYADGARGVLTSGGSMANFSAIITARHAILGDDVRDARIYVTDQAHHSIAKAARLAGFAPNALAEIPRDRELRMEPGALAARIAEDRAAGLRPCCVVVSAGTTNTGAVDPIGDVTEIAERERVWLHADGAYGGFFQLTDRGRARFSGIERADSITLDPHKCMFLPYGTGALVARDGAALRSAHSATGDYLQDLAADEEILPNFGEYGPEFTRSFRGLRVWLPLVLHGVDAFRQALDEKLDLTRWLYEDLRADPRLELPWEPPLTVVAFRHRDGDEATRAVLDRVNASRRVFFSSTRIDGRFYVRPCIVVHRTHRDRVEEGASLIREAAAAV